ncbi:MAG: N-acetylmuramoyl-L-alanine amidase [Bacillota bacterium]|nr:N-acetylmuramoyl-L-alanine amidase [Bacillota bacterium]
MLRKVMFVTVSLCVLILVCGGYYIYNKGEVIQARSNEVGKSATQIKSEYSKLKEKAKEQEPKDLKTNENLSTETVQATSNKKVIVIDPGHANRSNLEKEAIAPGSSDLKIKDGGGAEGIVTKTPEYKVNMQVAVRLKSILESRGYSIVMTKTEDSQSLGNIERAEVGNKANANLVVRIHADSSDDSNIRGASMLIPAPINSNTEAIYNESKEDGKIVLDTFVEEMGVANRGLVEHSDMTGFNWSRVPVILIEMGFLSNPDEDKLLSSSTYEAKLSSSLADGISKAMDR